MLRRDDLLFRIGAAEWLLVLAMPRIELDDFLNRTSQTLKTPTAIGRIRRFPTCYTNTWDVGHASRMGRKSSTSLINVARIWKSPAYENNWMNYGRTNQGPSANRG